MTTIIDPDFQNAPSVMALVENPEGCRAGVYVICRGDGVAAQIRNHLQRQMPMVAATSAEAWRVIPPEIKKIMELSTSHIVFAPEASLADLAYRLSQNASNAPSRLLISNELSEMGMAKVGTVGKSK